MKTYSRLRAMRVHHDTHCAKRRRLSSDNSKLSSDPEPRLPSSAAAASSSSPCSTPTISSDALSAEQSPPSSPPTIMRPAASAPTRRPTFSFLARRENASKPLIERDANAQKLSASPPPPPPPPPQSLLPGTKQKPKLVQMQIDLGGKLHRTCRTCGMEFIPSNAEDSLLHKKFHAMNVGGVDLGKAIEAEKLWRGDGDEGAFVVAVGPKSSLTAKRRVEKVLRVVQADLGAVEIPAEKLWEEVTFTNKRESVGGAAKVQARCQRHKAFLYIRGSKCIGFCLAERISTASLVIGLESDQAERKDPKTTTESSSISTGIATYPALMGISRIWTSSSHRRKGVAQTLLDCALKNFLYGIDIAKDMVAFSQPTESGGKLARQWFGAEHGWKVYADYEVSNDDVRSGKKIRTG